jgi:hypothetical protein
MLEHNDKADFDDATGQQGKILSSVKADSLMCFDAGIRFNWYGVGKVRQSRKSQCIVYSSETVITLEAS